MPMDNNSVDLMYSGLREACIQCHRIAVEHGFWEKDRNFGEMVALIHSELSEALEAHRTEPVGWEAHVCEELADAMIRIMDLAHGLKLPLENAIIAKMRKNEERPYKHGKLY